MSTGSFASLHAGLLSRKGFAAPSLEPTAPRPRPDAPPVEVPVAQQPPTVTHLRAVPSSEPARPAVRAPAPAADWSNAARPARASTRLTHEQSRALRLAALLLDRPQQELIAAGLDLRLKELACGSLASCACFKAVLEKLSLDDAPD